MFVINEINHVYSELIGMVARQDRNGRVVIRQICDRLKKVV